jgi:hypothetical protein
MADNLPSTQPAPIGDSPRAMTLSAQDAHILREVLRQALNSPNQQVPDAYHRRAGEILAALATNPSAGSLREVFR